MHNLSELVRPIGVITACLWLGFGGVCAKDRDAAREAFRRASEYHRWLLDQPADSRTLSQYERSIFLFRLVLDHDPTYGACDDSLFFIAQLFDEMAQHFRNDSYTRRAVYYYDFVAREYPRTRHREAATRRAAELRRPKPKPSPATASTVAPASFTDLATLGEVRFWSNEDYTRVVLQLDREVEFEKQVLEAPDRIYFDLLSARVNREIISDSYDVNGLFLRKLRLAENRPGVVRVVLDFERISQHTVFVLYDPFRIVIDTRGTRSPLDQERVDAGPGPGGEPVPSNPEGSTGDSPNSEGPSPTIQGNWTLTRTLGLKVGRIVLDPGHGGKDTGTIGPGGLKEKDLVLKVALQLRELLAERLQTEVILTREDDRFVPLEERTAVANQKGADLFVSIHANASRNRRASGVETYVLDFATTPAEIDAATRENATAQRTIRELEDLLRKIALGDYGQESRELAHRVQTQMVSLNGQNQKDRGIKQAPFIVLIGSNMPSILTEIGFISNPKDEKFFGSSDAQIEVAEALYRGIESYFRSVGTSTNIHQAATSDR